MGITVVDNFDARRYEIHIDGDPAGFAEYRVRPGMFVFVHTEIDPAYGGQGLGGTLASAALADVRQRGFRIVALCPFMVGYVGKHPEYADLTATPPSVA